MNMSQDVDIQKLNKELSGMGLEPIFDGCHERTAYYKHLAIDPKKQKKNWTAKRKILREKYIANFHKVVEQTYKHLLFEEGEDKVYWNYNEETGIYDEFNFSTVRGFVLYLLMKEGFEDKATEATAKTIMGKYRATYPEAGVTYNEFDSESDWFHAKNGWININSKKFEAHTPDRLSKRVSAVSYDAKAKCPVYDKFLDEQMQLQKDQIRAIDQFSGLLLTPDITKQKMLVIIGKPGSGKSTLLDCWSDVLGDCSTQTGLTDIASESFRFRGSTLVGKHLCWFDEVEVTRSNMGNHLINLITGQYIQVERKGINGIIEADNNLKCVLTANTLPRSAEMGIYRRMILIYLEYSFYDSMTANHNIREILNKESSGILNRMLKGLKDLNDNKGFTVISGHDEMIEDYKTSSNTVAEFLDEHFVFDESAEPIKSKVLLEAYKEFNPDRYSNSLTPQRFGVMLKQHGLSKFSNIFNKKQKDGNYWCGLKLQKFYEVNPAGYIREKEGDW